MLTIELTSTFLYLCEVGRKGGFIRVHSYDAVPTPEGSFKNGLITSMSELAAALRECIQKNRFKSKKVSLVLNSSAIVTREVTVPAVSRKEMPTLLRGEIEQSGGAQKQDYLLDYVILERANEQGAQVCRVLCVVMPRVIAEGCLDLVEKQLGLRAWSLDVVPHCIWKLSRLGGGFGGEGAAIVAGVSEDEINLSLIEGTDRIFYRTAPVNVVKDVVESEYILSSIGASSLVSDRMKEDQIVAAASENISKLVQFQSIKNKQSPVRALFVCTASEDEEALCARIAENVGIPARALPQPDFVQSPDGFPFGRFANAVAAAISL